MLQWLLISAALAIQPTILYLSTAVLSETNAGDKGSDSVLKSYKKVVTHPLNKEPLWERYTLSTLARLLDIVKTAKGNISFTQCRYG